MTDEPVNYKDTLTITKTDFPQKASLSQNEPERIAHWKSIDLERLIHEKGLTRPKYVLHDGPPYANGDIHLGHALNKVLKDIIVRYKTMQGFHAHYVPGFDCHGLPIEQKVIDALGKDEAKHSPLEIRQLCHKYATRYIGLQTEQFHRLGIGGQWEKPYLTLDPQYEVGIIQSLRAMVEKGYVYKGFKPVYWDPPLPHRPGGGRNRVPGARLPLDLCPVPRPQPRRLRAPESQRASNHRHLDHHPLDPPGQPRRLRPPGTGLRAGPLRRRATHRCR